MKHVSLMSSKKRFVFRAGIALIVVLVIIFGLVSAMRKQPSSASSGGNAGTASFDQANEDIPVYVLLVGVDGETPEQANFIGLAAVNKAKQRIDFMMFPDNTKIEGRKEKGIQNLQSIYSEGGLPLLRAVVEDVVHLPVPLYAVFTADSLEKLVDMADGQPLYVEQDMYHADAAGNTDINIFQGYQRLTGKEAVGYMRYIDENGYIPRTLRQERFVRLFYEERHHHFALSNWLLMYRFWNHVDSNIAAKDMAGLAFSFRNVSTDAIHFYILPGELAKDTESLDYYGTSYWTFDPVEVQKIIGTTSNSVTSAPKAADADTNT